VQTDRVSDILVPFEVMPKQGYILNVCTVIWFINLYISWVFKLFDAKATQNLRSSFEKK